MAGSAGRDAGPIRDRVIVDVLGQNPALFQQNPAAGDQRKVRTTTFSINHWVFVGVEQAAGPRVGFWIYPHLLARWMLTCGVLDSGSGTQSG